MSSNFSCRRKCAYKNCTRSYTNSPNLSFFKFPVKNQERCNRWITNSGQDSFTHLPDWTLKNKVLCSLHFKDSAFTNNSKKKLLPNNHDWSIPIPWFKNESELLKYKTEHLVGHDFQSSNDSQQNKDNTKPQPKKTNTKSPNPRKNKSMLSSLKSHTVDHDYLPFNDYQQNKDNRKPQPKKPNTKSPNLRKKKSMLSSLKIHRVDHDYLPFNESQQNKDNTNTQPKETNMKIPSPRKYKSMLASLKRYRVELKRSRSKIRYLMNHKNTNNKKLNSLEDISNCLTSYLTGDVLTFVKMQLVNKKKLWTEEEKSTSLAIYYKSPSTYRFLREKGFKLPCITLLRKWEKETEFLMDEMTLIENGLEHDHEEVVIDRSQDLVEEYHTQGDVFPQNEVQTIAATSSSTPMAKHVLENSAVFTLEDS